MPCGRATSLTKNCLPFLGSKYWFIPVLQGTCISMWFFRFWGPFMSFRPQHTQWLRGDMWRWNPPENDLHMEKGGGADGPNRAIQKGCMCTTFAKKSWILSGLQLWFPFFLAAFCEISMFWFDFLVLSVNVLRYLWMKSGPQISIPHTIGGWRC